MYYYYLYIYIINADKVYYIFYKLKLDSDTNKSDNSIFKYIYIIYNTIYVIRDAYIKGFILNLRS